MALAGTPIADLTDSKERSHSNPSPPIGHGFLEMAQKAGDAQPVHSCLSSLGQRQHGAVADEGALEAGSPGLDRGVACVVPPT